VLTEAIEAGRGAGVVRVTDVALAVIVTMSVALAATSTVEGALVHAHPMMIGTTALPDENVRMNGVLAVIATLVATLLAGVPASHPNPMRMSGTSGLSLCSSLPRAYGLKS
jgi:hypothetical protein